MNIWQRKLLSAGLSGYREEATDLGADSLNTDEPKQDEPKETPEELIARGEKRSVGRAPLFK